MGDKRPSLIDQMAIAAMMAEAGDDDFSSSEEVDDGDLEDDLEDDLEEGIALATDDEDDDEDEDEEQPLIFHSDLADSVDNFTDDDNTTDDDMQSLPSHVDSEGMDEFREDPSPLVSGFMSSSEELGFELEELGRSPAFNRRSSQTSQKSLSNSQKSHHSAPAEFSSNHPDYGYDAEFTGISGMARMERRRPLSISVPNAQGASSARRPSPRRQKLSTRTRKRLGSSPTAANLGSFENAIESLRNQNSNSEWENVAAAVIVAAESEKAAKNNKSQHHIKFMVNDKVLVFLTLLNVTNMEDPKDTFTVAPVNRFGFSSGEGRTETEKTGPYTFVLATVKHVHFDEDDRYYTVVRADTGTEQRADSGKWAQMCAVGDDDHP